MGGLGACPAEVNEQPTNAREDPADRPGLLGVESLAERDRDRRVQ